MKSKCNKEDYMVWSSKKRKRKNPSTALLKAGTSRRYHHDL